MSEQTHRSDPRIIGRRTLERDHRLLFDLLEPGLRVLDVGCGTGSITRGIRDRVGPRGWVLGIDANGENVEEAKRLNNGIENMAFGAVDILDMPCVSDFDIVNTARTLQWISDTKLAMRTMTRAAKLGGMVVALDYIHAENAWRPDPPDAFHRFYRAFLEWRDANGWDNRMGEHLAPLMEEAGLGSVQVSFQDEIARHGEPGFAEARELWPHIIDTIGPAVGGNWDEAAATYREWSESALEEQKLALRGAWGRVIK